eukprot:5041210-Alexandrium_andersonii.AAC.1
MTTGVAADVSSLASISPPGIVDPLGKRLARTSRCPPFPRSPVSMSGGGRSSAQFALPASSLAAP